MSDESSTDQEIRRESDEDTRPQLSRGAALSVLVWDDGDDADVTEA